MSDNASYGVLAEFDSSEELVAAANKAREAGYTKMDGYSPFPIEGLSEALGQKHTNLLVAVFIGGCVGALAGFGLQYYLSAVAYPYNIGGRPFNSWVSFIPIIFELTVLFASFTAVFGMIGLNGLPKPYHPVFKIEQFEAASRDKFFLCIEADDDQFEKEKCEGFLNGIGAKGVYAVEL